VLNAIKIDHTITPIPYQNLYIYYIEGPLNRDEKFLASWLSLRGKIVKKMMGG